MQEASKKWNAMDKEARIPFDALAAKDRARYETEVNL